MAEKLQWYVPPRRPYSRRELLADRLVNFVGVLVAWLGAPFLCWHSWAQGNALTMQGGFWVQGSGYIVMFTCSALYHYWSWDWHCVPWLLALDHVGINTMIMGCYAPYMLRFEYLFTLAFVWILGFVGMAMEAYKLYRYDLKLSGGGSGEWKPFDKVHGLLYVVMGWAALPMVPAVAPALPWSVIVGMVGGGVLFTVGIPVLAREAMEFHLAIWHAFVLAGSFCFYLVSLLQLAHLPSSAVGLA